MQAIKFILAFLSFSILTIGVQAQTPADMAKAREFETRATAAHRSGDNPAFLENIKQADALRPNHPRLIYNLARAYALNNRPEESVKVIKRMISMGLFYRFEADPNLKDLGQEKLDYIKKIAEDNAKPVNASTKAFTIPDKEFIPEGITYDPVTKRFFVSSIHKAKIVAIDTAGNVTDFSTAADGLWSVSGMQVDAKKRILWACTTAFPQMKGYTPLMKGRSGIVKYDLNTGKILKKYVLDGGEHALGDLILDSKGNVYATDSLGGGIYRIGKDDVLEVFVKSDLLVSPQGLALTSGDKAMFVADYAKGLFKVDMATREVIQLKVDGNVTLLGIDGLYTRSGGSLLAIQNGVNPQRLIMVGIDPAGTVRATVTREANHPDFMEPTLGVMVGNDLYYVANSQWPLVNEKAELDTAKLREPVILKLRLK